jgi:hypothetical protein
VVAYRNDEGGAEHIYAGSSIDGGLTWQVSDALLDGGAGPTIDPVIIRVGPPLTLGAGVAWIDFRSGTGVNGDPYLRRFGR